MLDTCKQRCSLWVPLVVGAQIRNSHNFRNDGCESPSAVKPVEMFLLPVPRFAESFKLLLSHQSINVNPSHLDPVAFLEQKSSQFDLENSSDTLSFGWFLNTFVIEFAIKLLFSKFKCYKFPS